MRNPNFCIHRAGQGNIGRLCVSQTFLDSLQHENKTSSKKKEAQQQPQTYFILDRSGSMGNNVEKMTNQVLPCIARNFLNLSSNDEIHFITFDTSVHSTVTTVAGLERMNIRCRGSTNMAGVFRSMQQTTNLSNPRIRIIAISDGEIWDRDRAMQEASRAAVQLKNHFTISATAVRLFTSQGGQPDTRALASILQLNTSDPGSILDVDARQNFQVIASMIGSALDSSSVGTCFTLKADSPTLLTSPWATPTDTIHLNSLTDEGAATIWLKDAIPGSLSLNDVPVSIDFGDPVTFDTMEILLEDKIKYFLSQLRVLKVINSPESKEEISRIVNYFDQLEDNLPAPTDLAHLLVEDKSLAGRTKYLKSSLARRLKSVVNTMRTIANDERIAQLNMAQQADYLRQIDGTKKTSRGLARRAAESGLDFESVMRGEIIAMALHFDDSALGTIDDSNHMTSFYSQATTLDGIRCMVDLAKNDPDILDNLSAPQMIRLFNIVGIPVSAPVGDFVDPFMYRVHKNLVGSFISVADITAALDVGGRGEELMAPGTNHVITNAIPIFENVRIQRFLQKHARSCLEYIASTGMRRVIADVPMTYPSTIGAGIRKMVQDLDTNKSEINIKLFERLVLTHQVAVGKYFAPISTLIDNSDGDDPSLAFDLGHNGIPNLLGPIFTLLKEKNEDDVDRLMPRILRALYSFEAYQLIRRMMRNDIADGVTGDARQQALDELLGVNVSDEGRATPMPPLFARPKNIQHCQEFVINQEALEKFKSALSFVHYTTLLRPLFDKVLHHDENGLIEAIQQIPTMSTETITRALDLPDGMDLDTFMLYNIVEALLNGNKSSRVDKDTEKPKLGDLGIVGCGQGLIQNYVLSRYQQDYEDRLKLQSNREKDILIDKLISQMCDTMDMDEYIRLLRKGIKIGEEEQMQLVIDRINSPGFTKLHDTLMDCNVSVKKRGQKLAVIYSGVDPRDPERHPVFNGGNMYNTDWEPLKNLLISLARDNVWQYLKAERSKRGHRYRDGMANRHGHSNDFPSYFAFGFQSLEAYHRQVSEEEWSNYITKHCNCCGVSTYLAKCGVAALGGS